MANISADFVIKLALILALSTFPSLVYLFIRKKAKKRWQARLRRAQSLTSYHYSYTDRLHYNDRYSSESYSLRERRRPITKYYIGDTNCVNNANSPYIRCAINPEGPCEDCVHFEQHQHQRDR